ncbi:cutinase transcription factor 1 beta [Halenospora varia]|nr:cutinase transcription factor 1 beta [Halenospora varia]
MEDGNHQLQATTRAAPSTSDTSFNETTHMEHALQDASTREVRERHGMENIEGTHSKNNSEANVFMETRPAFQHRPPWIDGQPQTQRVFNQNETSKGNFGSTLHNDSLPQSTPPMYGSAQGSQDECVPYSQYQFIKPDNFSHISTADVEFMKSQGAFQIPAMPALDEFVHEYFRHVHPHLPLIDEAAFWDTFYANERSQHQTYQISVFTFQAMLFACCNYVSERILLRVGFPSVRHARATLYRRAKASQNPNPCLLFDMDGKRDHISTAQGALLLSYSPDNHNRKNNTFWLGTGIRFAKDANAHRYDFFPAVTRKLQNTKKRLWWCCILRDRILPLGVRRPLYITTEHFDFVNNSPLTVGDLEDEIDHSKVYDPATKRSLVEVLAVLCQLAVVLTDIIMVVYPVSETPLTTMNEMALLRMRSRIEQCKSDLAEWLSGASLRFPTPAGLGDTSKVVVLFTNLMYIYYHTARVALYHHEVLLSEMGSNPDSGHPLQLQRCEREVQESVASMTDIMKELIQLKLARYMPLTMAAYVALPLILHILDVKLSSTRSQCAIRQRRLQIFMEALQVLQSQYDGTDRVSDYIEKSIKYLVVETQSNDGTPTDYPERRGVGMNNSVLASPSSAAYEKPGQTINDWGDLFMRRTNCYLRTVVTVDLALSKGQFPEEHDFPMNLRSDKLSAVLPLYRIDRNAVAENSVHEVGEPQAGSNQSFHHNRYMVAKDSAAMFDSTINSFQDVITPVLVRTIDSGYQIDSASSSGGDQAFAASRDFPGGSIGEGMFDIETWIYDLLPNLV